MSPHPIARRFAYQAWANREALRSLQSQADRLPDRTSTIIAHLVGAERVWLGRVGGPVPPGDPAHPIWPDLSLDESAEAFAELARSWPAVLGRYLPDRLGEPVTYTTSRGETFTSAISDIFEHLLLHGAYHRGQVATLLGRAGLPPSATDFILWARGGEPSA